MYVVITILLLLFIIPLFFAFKKLIEEKRNEKGMRVIEDAFKRVVDRHRLTISESSKFINRLIAIDRQTGTLVLIIDKGGITWEKCLNLQEIRSCKIVKSSDHVSGYIVKVAMEVGLHNSQELISFPFFEEHMDDASDLARRTKLSRYWQRKIMYCMEIPSFKSSLAFR